MRHALALLAALAPLPTAAHPHVFIGTGLTDKPDALLWGGGLVLSEGARAAITATVEQGGLVGVLNQLGYVIGGFGLLAVACWPIPLGRSARP